MYFKTSGGAHDHAIGFVMEKADLRIFSFRFRFLCVS